MQDSFYIYAGLFFLYSFFGWLLETLSASIRKKHFANRGYLNGPFCAIYGFTAVFMTLFLYELEGNLPFLFLGCMIIATVAEWTAGHLLERIGHGKWWDYSKLHWNLDGYICLSYSVVWGILGTLAIRVGNPLIEALLHHLPHGLMHGVIWGLFGLLLVDALGSCLALHQDSERMPHIAAFNHQLAAFTHRLSLHIYHYVDARVERAYTLQRRKQPRTWTKCGAFAEGCSFYKIVLLFIIGSFVGDLVETIFCRLTAGVWMSRSSLVCGPFSVVWGLAIAMVTLLFYNYRNRSDGFLFMCGTFLGGAYEYICSVFTERVFGKVFWDYSGFRFNLGGRINLLFCFFWGIAAVVWLKKLYPLFSELIEKIPQQVGPMLTWGLLLFMSLDILVSSLALARYDQRAHQRPATNAMEQALDHYYPDNTMKKIYPNAKIAK